MPYCATSHDPLEYLAKRGYSIVTPQVRSSDYELVLADPFLYWLKRRLGLRCVTEYSAAFSLGTRIHDCYELSLPGGPVDNLRWNTRVAEREAELRDDFKCGHVSLAQLQDRLLQESDDASMAYAWYEVLRRTRTSTGDTFQNHFNKMGWERVATELEAEIEIEGIPVCVRWDAVLVNSKLKSAAAVDIKSTSKSPEVRAAKCPIEFQTQLYSEALRTVIEDTDLRAQYLPGVPSGYHVGPFFHIILQKPTIRFGQSDRPHSYVAHSKRSGRLAAAVPKQGQWLVRRSEVGDDASAYPDFFVSGESEAASAVEAFAEVKAKKEFAGEPSLDVYLSRCEEWYSALDHCPIEVSATRPLTESERDVFCRRMSLVQYNASHQDNPLERYDRPSNIETFGGLSKWAPFYLRPVEEWPDIIYRNNFIIDHRNTPITETEHA